MTGINIFNKDMIPVKCAMENQDVLPLHFNLRETQVVGDFTRQTFLKCQARTFKTAYHGIPVHYRKFRLLPSHDIF